MKNLVVSSGAALPVKYFLEFEAKLGRNLKKKYILKNSITVDALYKQS